MSVEARRSTSYLRKRNLLLFLLVAMDWFAFDIYTKGYANGFEPGELFGGPFLGLFDFRLVHNTGGAFGAFGDATLVLGALSLAVCLVVVVYLVKLAPRSSVPMVIGLALVFAGGLGNAVDRFSYGYVIDFIEPLFIDFPVFNIADIGVTCGIVIVFLTFLLEGKKQADERSKAEAAEAPKPEKAAAATVEVPAVKTEPDPRRPTRRIITPPELEDEDDA